MGHTCSDTGKQLMIKSGSTAKEQHAVICMIIFIISISISKDLGLQRCSVFLLFWTKMELKWKKEMRGNVGTAQSPNI